jgi:hypothetical protein
MSIFASTAFFNIQAPAAASAQFVVRTDTYSASVVIGMPGTTATNLGMTNYYDDISSQIRGAGSNASIIPSGSGANARLWASASVVSSGSFDFSSNGYATSAFSSGSQNVGFLPSGVLGFGTSNFVIEYWINYGPTGFTQPPFNKGISSPGNSPNVFDFPGFVPRYRVIRNDNQYFFPQAQTLGTWYHIAYVRTGAFLYLYINGTRHATTFNIGTGAGFNASAYHLMGINSGNTNDGAPSRFNDLRITIGSDRGYTGSTITVPNSIIYK